ncbi:MAG: hypothetical protein ABJF10_17850 [Chthoniobacter sp.]|uniref:hypothetical protein n=1 Tax=Chthoniobacter sp. TaxID=2510640 RepID=UPI0032AC0CFF
MPRTRAFTILEVALIVAIIGMMLMMIVGYLLAPKQGGPLPPVKAQTQFMETPSPSTPDPRAAATPALTTPIPVVPAPATPAPVATPAPAATQTIDLSPQSSPIFR